MVKPSPVEPAPDAPAEIRKFTLRAVERLGRAQCTPDEMAGYFGLTVADVEARLATPQMAKVYRRGKAAGVVALREAQFKLAATSVPMATLLGKFYLSQNEPRESDDNAPYDRAAAAERIRAKILSVAFAARPGDAGQTAGDPG